MPKKLGGTDDFNPKKQNRINDFREGRRFSFRVPGNVPQPDTECGKLDIPDYARNKQNVGRGSGDAVLYSGEQLENYKKQYPRFERAIDLIPDGKVTRDGNQVYLYCSKQSPTGYWEVTAFTTVPTYFIDAGDPLTIICPVPYHITQVESNGEAFKWTQLEGGRLAVVDPINVIDPELLILDNIRDERPIRFRVEIEGKPEINDELIIYTTPTETIDGVSADIIRARPNGEDTRQIINVRTAAPLPVPITRAYVSSDGTSTFVIWDLPTQYSNFITEMVWQVNTTGEYLTIATYARHQPRILQINLKTHYRVISKFNQFGYLSELESDRIYLQEALKQAVADEVFNGVSTSFTDFNKTVLPLDVKRLTSIDLTDGFSTSKTDSSITVLPLNVERLSASDLIQGMSTTFINATKTVLNIGGVIIG